MFHRTDDVDRVDGGEAGAEEERATQASATITKNAAHLKKDFLQYICSQFHYPSPYGCSTHLIKVVTICKYFVLVTLQKTNWPMVQMNKARMTL